MKSMAKRRSTKEETTIEVNGQPLPLVIYREFRRSIRASLGRRHIILRLPYGMGSSEESARLGWLQNWLTEQSDRRPQLFSSYLSQSRKYQTGDTYRIQQQQFALQIVESDKQSHSGKITDSTILLRLGKTSSALEFNEVVQKLLSRIFGQHFQPMIEGRVRYWNNLHFQQPLQSVKLRYTHSRWGSCSSKGNINLSTRLLLAPEEVVDYIIVHELSHLLEFNHSPRFWKIVGSIMPDYKRHEKWLKMHGPACDF
jgi:predicted metal-dependent hydrolase